MWPWESAAFAYICYSAFAHAWWGERPGGGAVVLAAVASVLPDVIDKPLGWQYGVFQNGYALGHSFFFGLLVLGVAHAVARRSAHPTWGLAFGIGYLSHNVGDVLEYLPTGRPWYALAHGLWPVVVLPPGPRAPFGSTVVAYLREYLFRLVHLDVTPYFVIVGVIVAFALALWAYDGFPVLRELVDRVRAGSG